MACDCSSQDIADIVSHIALSWQVLSRGPSGDRIARSCRHMGPDLTTRIRDKDRIAKLLLSQYVLGFWGPFQTMIVCPEIKQKQPQDHKTIIETLSLPVA